MDIIIAGEHDAKHNGINYQCFIPAWVINEIHYKVWNEITYTFPNFNGEDWNE